MNGPQTPIAGTCQGVPDEVCSPVVGGVQGRCVSEVDPTIYLASLFGRLSLHRLILDAVAIALCFFLLLLGSPRASAPILESDTPLDHYVYELRFATESRNETGRVALESFGAHAACRAVGLGQMGNRLQQVVLDADDATDRATLSLLGICHLLHMGPFRTTVPRTPGSRDGGHGRRMWAPIRGVFYV